MCITFVYLDDDTDSRYKLIILNNRDEFLDRPTSVANWENGVLAGRDEKEKNVRGTWLCIDKDGRISNLLSITIPYHERKRNAPSRGRIPLAFMESGKTPKQFCENFIDNAKKYDAFQVLCLQRNQNDEYEMCCLANKLVDSVTPVVFTSGLYGFSNSPYDKPFKKVHRGLSLMKEAICDINEQNMSADEVISKLIDIATDRVLCHPDKQLQMQCGRSGEICKYRTSVYVQYPDGIRYGTRSHTVILVDRSNKVTYYEKRMVHVPNIISNAEWDETKFTFSLNMI